MGKVLYIDGPGPRRPVRSSNRRHVRREPQRNPDTMTQRAVWTLFLDIAEAEDPDRACEILTRAITTRSRLTFWLGQIGHRRDFRLGYGEDLNGFIRAVACKLWARAR